MKIIYADNNATTRIAPEVYEAMIPFFTDDYFNPSSMYDAARGSGEAISGLTLAFCSTWMTNWANTTAPSLASVSTSA